MLPKAVRHSRSQRPRSRLVVVGRSNVVVIFVSRRLRSAFHVWEATHLRFRSSLLLFRWSCLMKAFWSNHWKTVYIFSTYEVSIVATATLIENILCKGDSSLRKTIFSSSLYDCFREQQGHDRRIQDIQYVTQQLNATPSLYMMSE